MRKLRVAVALCSLWIMPHLIAQALPRPTTLSVAGATGEAPVVQVNGHSYVDVQALAQMTGATMQFQGRRIVMLFPNQTAPSGSAAGNSPPAQATQAPAAPAGLSREFVTSAVGAVSSMREWRVALVSSVQRNQPIADDLMSPYRRNSETQVALAAAAAHNSADRNAATLLQNELGNLRTLSGNYISLHDSNTNIRTDALDTDALSIKVQNCLQGLAGMSVGSTYQDIATCH